MYLKDTTDNYASQGEVGSYCALSGRWNEVVRPQLMSVMFSQGGDHLPGVQNYYRSAADPSVIRTKDRIEKFPAHSECSVSQTRKELAILSIVAIVISQKMEIENMHETCHE